MTRLLARSPLAALLLAACALMSAPLHAQIDTLKVLIGANPGGGFDQTGRGIGAAMLAAGAAKRVAYENRGGAGGTIALAQFVNTDKGNPAVGTQGIGGWPVRRAGILRRREPRGRLRGGRHEGT